MMRRRRRAAGLVLVALAALLLAACGQRVGPRVASPTTGPTEFAGGEADPQQIVDALGERGAAVDAVVRQDASYFHGAGFDLTVNGASVRVFVYADESARAVDSSAISADGWELTREEGEVMVVSHLEWMERPSFWAQGRFLTLYLGTDEAMQRLLSGALGEPLTAHTLLAEGYPRAALRAQEMARAVSSLSDPQIEIVSYEQVIWPDSCLGAALEGDACAEVETPGWIVGLRGPGGVYAMHTDLFGERMRRGPDLSVEVEPTATTETVPGPTPTATVFVPTATPMVPTPTPLIPTPTVAPGGLALYSNPFFGVSFLYPDHWQRVEGEPETGERYEGHDGFFLLGAMDAGDRELDDVAAQEAGHVLRPYGTEPMIEAIKVDGQAARLILPSEDQSMGPLGQAIVIVRYPVPVEVGGHLYPLFTLTGDPGTIEEMALSLVFLEE